MYKVLLSKQAEHDLRRLPANVFRQVVPRIQALAKDPRPSGCRKLAGSVNDWRIRVGNYRVVYEINDKKLVVRVMRVRPRKEAYR